MTDDTPDIRDESTVVRSESHLSATLDDEAVLLDSKSGMYYGMNEVGTRMWEQLESPTSIAELRRMLTAEYDVDEDIVDSDIREFILDLVEADLVELRTQNDGS